MCKRMVLPLMLLSLAMVVWVGSAFAYTIDDMYSTDPWTPVQANRYWNNTAPNYVGHYSGGHWYDFIGSPPQFQVHGIGIDVGATTVTLNMYTNFNNDGWYHVNGDNYAFLADVAIDTGTGDSGEREPDGTFDYGIRLLGYDNTQQETFWRINGPDPYPYANKPGLHNGIDQTIVQGLYEVDNWQTSQGLWNNQSVIYGQEWNNPSDIAGDVPVEVAISSTTAGPLADVDLAVYDAGGSGAIGSPLYRWEATMNYTVFTNATNHPDAPGMGLAVGDTIGILWGGATCANDVIYGTWTVTEPGGGDDPIPEPGTLLLLGFGLLGLSGYTIHRKKKSS
jgi:hypothetical protein